MKGMRDRQHKWSFFLSLCYVIDSPIPTVWIDSNNIMLWIWRWFWKIVNKLYRPGGEKKIVHSPCEFCCCASPFPFKVVYQVSLLQLKSNFVRPCRNLNFKEIRICHSRQMRWSGHFFLRISYGKMKREREMYGSRYI